MTNKLSSPNGDNPGGQKPSKIREIRKQFSAKLNDESVLKPSDYLLGVLNGEEEFDQHKYMVAKDMIGYELPRLQSVEAENRNVDMTFEEALKDLQDDEDHTHDNEDPDADI